MGLNSVGREVRDYYQGPAFDPAVVAVLIKRGRAIRERVARFRFSFGSRDADQREHRHHREEYPSHANHPTTLIWLLAISPTYSPKGGAATNSPRPHIYTPDWPGA